MQGKKERIGLRKGALLVFFLTAMLGMQYQAQAQLNGTYTIGGTSPNYATFSAAVSALNSSGVSGPVVFNIRSGTQTGGVTINAISGASSTNTITFQSETGVDTDVVIQANSTADVIALQGTNYLTIKNLTVSYYGTSTQSAIELRDAASNNTIEGCILRRTTSVTSTTFSYAVVYSSETASSATYYCQNNTISNNTIIGSNYGIYYAFGSAKGSGVVIEDNTFENQYYRGIYVDDHVAPLSIARNTLTTNTTYSSGYEAIAVYDCDNEIEIVGNTIYGTGNIKYGINLQSGSSGTSSNPILIANNMVQVGFSSQPCIGIYLYSLTTYVNVFFNTVHVTASNTTNTYRGALVSFSDNNDIRNNVLTNTGGGTYDYAIYVVNNNTSTTFNYNNYYVTGTNLGRWQSSYYTCLSGCGSSSWATKTGQDGGSLSIDPQFTSSTDLHVSATALAAGTSISGLTTDIDGDIRQTPPYIGADEIAAPAVANDAAVTGLALPTLPPCPGTVPFEVTVANYGTNTMTSVTINWSINGAAQTPVNATGLSVATNGSTTVSLGNVTLSSNMEYDFVFIAANPNGGTDGNNTNDTYTLDDVYTSLNGTYTIGGTSPDFTDFNAAVDALHTYGVCGPVVFNVRQGTYTEQVEINAIAGTSGTNTVTFQADAANTNPAILQYNGQTFAQNYVLGFDGAAYLRFIGLTIQTTLTSGSYRSVIGFANSNNDIRFEDNTIEAQTAPSNSVNYAVVYMDDANGTFDNNIVFEGNEILNGSYGIYMQSYTNTHETGNQILGNTITGFYRTGIFASYQDGIVIEGNEVRGSGPYLIAADFADFVGYVSIVGNIFEAAGSSSGGSNIAMEMLDCDGSSGTPSLVANNFFIATAPGNTVEGIRFGSSTIYYDFVANNIYVSGTNASSTSGVYFNGADEIGFYSNNVFCDGPGNCIEYLTTSNSLYSNYNNLAVANGGIVGYYNANRNTLGDWQSAAGMDGNSVSIDPVYTSLSSPFDLHISESSLAGAGSAYTGITNDIDADPRDTPPTIGADEITPTGCTTPIAGNTISGGGAYCASAPAGTISGAVPTGGIGSYTYTWEVSTDGSTYTNAGSSSADFAHGSITTDTWYRRIAVSGQCEDTSTTVQFAVTPAITGNTIAGDGLFCDEIPAGTITGATPAGGDGSYTYQWQESADGTSFANVASSGTSSNYDHLVQPDPVWYQRVVTSGQCTSTSNTVSLDIKTGYIWTGDINTNWHIPANWDCGDVPDYTKDVTIPAAPVNQPEILTDSIGECRTIIMENGSELIIRSEGRLNVEN